MRKISILLSILSVASVASADLTKMSVKEASELVSQPTIAVQSVLENKPEIYDFKNEAGASSVSYTGQSLRQVLINDSKLVFSSILRGRYNGDHKKAFNALNSFYEYKADNVSVDENGINGAKPIRVKAKNQFGSSITILEYNYLDVLEGSKDLKSKIAGVDNDLRHGVLLGWDTMEVSGQNFDKDQSGDLTADELVQGYMNVIAANAAGSSDNLTFPDGMGGEQSTRSASVTATGLDLTQLTQKLLHVAVSFSQAAGDYMSVDLGGDKGLLASNDPVEGKSYTTLQHHWDEAFGYFGAARNYAELSVLDVRKGYSVDTYNDGDYKGAGKGDGEISVLTEKSFGLSVNAAKRDVGAAGKDTSFKEATMDAFLSGRYLLQEKPEGYLKYAQAYSVLAIDQWERTIAATVIHYINALMEDVQMYGVKAVSDPNSKEKGYHFLRLAKHFSEMKGFAFAFQFNPNSAVAIEDFKRFHELVGDTPMLPENGNVDEYVENLLEARMILQDAFSFSDTTVKAW